MSYMSEKAGENENEQTNKDELEKNIIKAIGEGKRRTVQIVLSLPQGAPNNFRVLDNALRRLKTKKKITYNSKTGWELIKENPTQPKCSKCGLAFPIDEKRAGWTTCEQCDKVYTPPPACGTDPVPPKSSTPPSGCGTDSITPPRVV